MIAYFLTFLLCVGRQCSIVEVPFDTLQGCMLQAQPVAAFFASHVSDKAGVSVRVEHIQCTTERRA